MYFSWKSKRKVLKNGKLNNGDADDEYTGIQEICTDLETKAEVHQADLGLFQKDGKAHIRHF